VNFLPESALQRLFVQYGEERLAGVAARAIAHHRAMHGQFNTTGELSRVLDSALRRARSRGATSSRRSAEPKGAPPSTRCFQALRIAVNDELRHLDYFLRVGPSLIRAGGSLAVLTFHSIEERMVRRAMRKGARTDMAQAVDDAAGVSRAESAAFGAARRPRLRPGPRPGPGQ